MVYFSTLQASVIKFAAQSQGDCILSMYGICLAQGKYKLNPRQPRNFPSISEIIPKCNY